MHDTGRNYQPVSLLKETLDLMSFYKLNYFHWHLTDNHAWRIECKAYLATPAMTTGIQILMVGQIIHPIQKFHSAKVSCWSSALVQPTS